jgi:hypothetical protein
VQVASTAAVTAAAVPNDPLYTAPGNQLWHLKLISTQAAWEVTTGDGTVPVCIVDSGVNYE